MDEIYLYRRNCRETRIQLPYLGKGFKVYFGYSGHGAGEGDGSYSLEHHQNEGCVTLFYLD